MEQIARKSGVKKASLYHHFPSKRALYLEVLREIYRNLQNAYGNSMSQNTGYLERAHGLVRYTIQLLGENPPFTQLALRSLLDRDPLVVEFLHREGKALLDGLKVFAELGIAEGDLHPYPVEMILLIVFGICLAPYLSPELNRLFLGTPTLTSEKEELYIQTALSLLMEGLSRSRKLEEGKVIPLSGKIPEKR
jgi:AcrR family transcriptional regulator